MTSPTSSPPTKAIIFDLLTALLDSWTLWDLSIPTKLNSASSDANTTTTATTPQPTGLTWRKEYLNLTYTCGRYQPYESLVSQSANNVGLPPECPATLVRNMDNLQPWPEVPHVLIDLKTRGFKLGVVTNCSNDLGLRAIRNCEKSIRQATGDETFEFDQVVTAEESGFYKPDPKPYLDVLKKLDVAPTEALFVAGSSADIPGASGVGMRVVWNNHVGLERRDGVVPLKEGRDLAEALEGALL